MPYPYDPLDVRVRLHLAGDWRDITKDVRRAGGITTQYGRPPESRTPVAAQAWLTLNNHRSEVPATLGQVGAYSRRNVLGPWYGHLNRNTPIEISAGLLDAPMGGTAVNGWAAVDGHAWSTSGGSAGDYQENGGYARHSVATNSVFRLSYLPAMSHGLVDAAVSFSLPAISSVTGGSLEPANLVVRGLSSTDYYMVRVLISAAQDITVQLYRRGDTPLTGAEPTGLSYAAGTEYRVRVQADGWALRAKVWRVADGEPYGWHASVDTNWILGPGFVGVRSGISTGNTNTKPIEFRYRNFEVRLPRFAGEVSAWPKEWGHGEVDSRSPIEAAGILRRLGQGASPLRSALYRAIVATNPSAYWPLEDGKNADWAASGLIGGSPMIGEINFSATDGPPGSDRVLDLSRRGEVHGTIPAGASSTAWFAAAAVRWPDVGSVAATVIAFQVSSAGSVQLWRIVGSGDPTRTIDLVYFPVGAGVGTHVAGTIGAFDGQWHWISLAVNQVGSMISVNVIVDGVTAAQTSIASSTLGAPLVATVLTSEDATDDTLPAVSHYGVWAQGVVPDLSSIPVALQGWPGERAGERMQRLCEQEGIPLTIAGDPAETEAMGPQRVATVLALVEECAVVDGGPLGEQRSASGLAYQTRADLYNQAAALTLNYGSVGHVTALVPVDDDLLLRNDVTVTRQDGGSARHELTAGPMSVQDPPSGVGRYDDGLTLNLQADAQAAGQAQWRVHLGTWDGDRYNQIMVRLHALAGSNYNLAITAAETGPADRIVITDPPVWCGPDDIDQLVGQIVEELGEVAWSIEYRAAPAGPWQVFEVGHDTLGRIHADGHTLSVGIDDNDVSLSVATPAGGALWTAAAADLPLDIVIGGERMTVTAISGASSPQTFTATRSVNGVVKAHDAGDAVDLFSRHVVAL